MSWKKKKYDRFNYCIKSQQYPIILFNSGKMLSFHSRNLGLWHRANLFKDHRNHRIMANFRQRTFDGLTLKAKLK